MMNDIYHRIEVYFRGREKADQAINYMKNILKESNKQFVSVYDLIEYCGYLSVSWRFAQIDDKELRNWGWTNIDGYSMYRNPVKMSITLTMPPAERMYYPLTSPPQPYKEMYINIPRGCGKTMTAMKIIEDICKNTKLREEINSKIKKYSDKDFYGFRFVLEYRHQPCEKRYRVEYRIPFDASCFLEFWPDEEVDKYFDEQENKARKELIDRVINDINKGDVNNMPLHMNIDLGDFTGVPKYTPICEPAMTTSSIRVHLPKIVNIEMYNDRVVKVTFDDGSFTKSVCQENDIFDLDVGITICLIKKMLDTGKGDGTKIYNNIIRDAHKLINDKENEKIEKQMEKEKEKKKARKALMNKQAKKMKAKEEAIDIQKQAIIRAYQEMELMKDGE